MTEKTIVIGWERIDPWRNVLDMNDENDYGVYQVTGCHVVFGDNSLLYVGMVQKQTFGERFNQHENWLKDEWGVMVYIGRILSIDDQNESIYHGNAWNPVVISAEKLLIYFHSPPYNSKSVSSFPDPGPNHNLRIINTGDYGCLLPELSHKGLRLYSNKLRPIED